MYILLVPYAFWALPKSPKPEMTHILIGPKKQYTNLWVFIFVGWGRCLVKQINFEIQTHNILFKIKIVTLLFRKLNPHKFWIRVAEFFNQTQATCLGFSSFQNWKTVNQLPLLDFAKIENLSMGTTVQFTTFYLQIIIFLIIWGGGFEL